MHDFEKASKKSYEIESVDFNQMDFLIIRMMFVSGQYQLVDKLEDKEKFMKLKLIFHAVRKRKSSPW